MRFVIYMMTVTLGMVLVCVPDVDAANFSGAVSFVSGGVATSYLLEEKYEGVGIPSGHSYVDSSGTNKIDWDDATPTMEGSKSSYYPDPGSSGQNKVQIDPGTDEDEMWVSFMVVFADTGAGTAVLFRMSDTADSDVVQISKQQDNDVFISVNSGGNGSGIVCRVSLDTIYYIKIRAKKGTGANAEAEAWCSSTTTSWGPSQSSANGTWTNQIDYFEVNNYYAWDHDYNIDHVVINDADIPITVYQ